jgi:hypothetical protein
MGNKPRLERREKRFNELHPIRGGQQELANHSAGIGLALCPETGGTVKADVYNPQHIRCLATPTLATVIQQSFDCVICDEAVRLKNRYSLQAQGVFRLQARYRLALTGTPIKNRLPDIALLNWWVTGSDMTGDNPRWPYTADPADLAAFAEEHLILEDNQSEAERRRAAGEKSRSLTKQTAQLCNVHRFWKLIGPVVLRGRKADLNADLVTKTIRPIYCAMGQHQASVYKWELDNPPTENKRGEPMNRIGQIGAQLQALRQTAVDPSSPNLRHPSPFQLSHKCQAILERIADLLSKGEQYVIMSPFQSFGAMLTERLQEAGIHAARLDGSMSPTARGKAVARFKRRELSVLVCGQAAMSEGHSLDCCAHLGLVSLDWACDKNLQAVDRVHRMNSTRPVTIDLYLTHGTIDMKLEYTWDEKADTCNLALDGRLITEHREETTMLDLIADSKATFQEGFDTMDEADIAAAWPATIKALRQAQANYATHHPHTTFTDPHHPTPWKPLPPFPTPAPTATPPKTPSPQPSTTSPSTTASTTNTTAIPGPSKPAPTLKTPTSAPSVNAAESTSVSRQTSPSPSPKKSPSKPALTTRQRMTNRAADLLATLA